MKYISLIILLLTITSCYSEINLDDYKDDEGGNLLTINSIVNPDSTISACATRTFFFSDSHNARSYVDGLDMRLYVNSQLVATMKYNASTHLYESDIKPQQGDTIKIETHYMGEKVLAEDVVPKEVEIESIDAERLGPMYIYYENDYKMTYKITFSDNPDEENYYFLQYDAESIKWDMGMGERDFTYEFAFQQLARQVNSILPGWEPYSPYGLPFSDNGINGKQHTLVVKEIVQSGFGGSLAGVKRMNRKFLLYSISKSYYDYLVSILCNKSDDGIHGGMIDLGVSDPVKITSNITGGTGILGSYSLNAKTIDIFSITGPFPR